MDALHIFVCYLPPAAVSVTCCASNRSTCCCSALIWFSKSRQRREVPCPTTTTCVRRAGSGGRRRSREDVDSAPRPLRARAPRPQGPYPILHSLFLDVAADADPFVPLRCLPCAMQRMIYAQGPDAAGPSFIWESVVFWGRKLPIRHPLALPVDGERARCQVRLHATVISEELELIHTPSREDLCSLSKHADGSAGAGRDDGKRR
ncbi:hypothetical protein B0H17DRAFT_574789 [Mycena rosella]|uniref:Uncharacterized protein n=1 Tax=Mycena rosella TaxID=1033263 RepID=A0AAD7DH48_MYCRO|nr:hypothetical protein B0H17DRAFT_574789 [Mycena rosella]